MQQDSDQPGFPIYDFGWWSEITGAIAVTVIIRFLIVYSDGIL